MDDQTICPKCKTTKYRNPSLVLKVNVCGHALCESCIEMLYPKGSGPCYECQIPLRRTNFKVQLFEDSSVDKEVEIRRKILREYNKRQEDFSSLREYNDYLEEVENIIFNLVFDVDTVDTNKRIDTYKRENKDLIQRNRNRAGQEELELEELIEAEKAQQREKAGIYVNAELEEKKQKHKAREKLIDELMFSDADAKSIVASHVQAIAATAAKAESLQQQQLQKPKIQPGKFSSGVQIGVRGNNGFLPVPKADDGPLYSYIAPVFDYNGPNPPAIENLGRLNYFANIRLANAAERAGGYTEAISCCRALQEAMSGLFYCPQPSHRTSSGVEEMETT